MRLSRSTALWLAAASSVGTARGENITFTGFDGTNSAAVFTPEPFESHPINWQVDTGMSIDIGTVKLYVAGTLVGTAVPEATAVPMPTRAATVTLSTSTPTSPPIQSVKARAVVVVGDGALMKDGLDGIWGKSGGQDTEQSLLQGIITVTKSSSNGTIALTNIKVLLDNSYGGQEMWFELDWAKPSGGKSYSRAFTVAAAANAQLLSTNPMFTNATAVFPEVPADDNNGNGIPEQSTSATASTTPAATGQGLTPTTTGKPSTSTSATSSGLATGAKIGIGVGVSLGALLLIGGLIFFLMRRRRSAATRHDSAYLNSGHGGHHTPELIAQKEANAGVSPHSPYSDDGLGGGATRTPLPAHPPAMSQTYDRASLRSVRDAPGGSVRDGRDSVSVRGVDATGRGSRGGAVSHLVEEGMTEDEIRRLEEEERELDQAIEQAGAGRGR